MAKAYFVNGRTNTEIRVTLNGGSQNTVAPASVSSGGTAINTPAWGAEIEANKRGDVFGKDDLNEVQIYDNETPMATNYRITSTHSVSEDLFFYVFWDNIVGQNYLGKHDQITIERREAKRSRQT